MGHILLIGAGFSRNWGGYLANDFFDKLIGAKELDENCRKLLWQYKEEGFEKSLSVLQNEGGESLPLLEQALRSVFQRMNTAFFDSTFSLEFIHGQNVQPNDSIKRFLARFDAIFTLNQDILLESGYMAQSDPPQAFGHRWSDFSLPGMIPRVQPSPLSPLPRWCGEFCPDPQGVKPTSSGIQPIYKLHGSSNWVDEKGERLIIMGGEKTAKIGGSNVLAAYAEEFGRRLNEPEMRLMIIGYGFGDGHINAAIEAAATVGGLRTFIVDPRGSDAPNRKKAAINQISLPQPINKTQASLIGASRLSLREIFGGNRIERDDLLGFFAN